MFNILKRKKMSDVEKEAKKREREKKKLKKANLADKMSLVKYKQSISYQIPFEILLDKRTFTTKYVGFGRVVKLKCFDFDYVAQPEREFLFSKFNSIFKNLPENTYLHYDLIRTKDEFEKPINRPFAPISTRLAEEMRYRAFEKKNFFKNEIFITFSYVMPLEKGKALQDFMLSENTALKDNENIDENTKSMEVLRKEHKQFEESFQLFLGLLKNAVQDFEVLEGTDLMNYLSYSLNPINEVAQMNRMSAPVGTFLDSYIPYSPITDEAHLMVGDYYTKVISQNFLPNEITWQTFRRIFALPLEMRFTSRYIPMTKEEAINFVKSSQSFYNAKKYSMLQYAIMATDKKQIGNMEEDEHAKGLSEEARLIMQDLRNDEVGIGIITQTLVLQDKDLKKLEDNTQMVLREFMSVDIKAVVDKYNGLDAYIGAVPANLKANIRKMPIHTTAFPYFVQTYNSWQGERFSKAKNDEAIIKTLNKAGEKFYFDFFDKDVGNSIILGNIGAGKSVLLNSMANYFMKHKGSQIFFFDVDSSSRVLCKANGGVFYDVGGEKDNIQFQPLKRIDTNQEKIFANDFIISLIGQEDERLITPKSKEIIWEAIKSLSTRPVSERTITAYCAFLQDDSLKLALKPYTREGAFGTFFDGNSENIDEAQMVVFEMGKIMGKPKIVNPLSMYLMNYIETQKLTKGILTGVFVDEASIFFSNQYFAPILERQLLTSRKKNCHFIFATQSGEHITRSPIKATIVNQCFTKILIPNRLMTEDWVATYKLFGLNDAEIEAVRVGEPKRDYFVKNRNGATVFSLEATPIDLAYTGVADKKLQNAIDIIEENSSDLKQVNINWLKHLHEEGRINKFDLEEALELIDSF